MVLRPPEGFTTIADAAERRGDASYNVIGLCVDYLPPAQTHGTDLGMKISLWDFTCDDVGLGQDGFPTRHFFKVKCRFPAIGAMGDVVVLHHMNTVNAKGAWIGRSGYNTRWVVIDGQSLLNSTRPEFSDVILREPYQPFVEKEDRRGPRPSSKDFRYAKSLLQRRDPTSLRGPPKTTALEQAGNSEAGDNSHKAFKSTKLRLVKDLEPPANSKLFVDLVGELQNVFLTGRPLELKVSDYTENEFLYEYSAAADSFRKSQWTYPTGKMTIQINCWEGMADYVRELADKNLLQLGMYVKLQNVNVRLDKMGGKLEGNLSGGASFGTAITFVKADDARNDRAFDDLRKRIHAYKSGQNEKAVLSKRAAEDNEDDHIEQPPNKKSKNARKKKNRREREAKAQAEGKLEAQVESKPHSNGHVRCEAIDVELTSLADILNESQLEQTTVAGNAYKLPFRNCKYKTRVKVIDFFPDKLEDFAIQPKGTHRSGSEDSDDDMSSQRSYQSDVSGIGKDRWEWFFFLMVQDSQSSTTEPETPKTMLLQVTGADAEYLLNMEACDLRKDRVALHKLKEKLFVLWGDLEEKKTEYIMTGEELQKERVAVSSTPFECMIKEFGVSARDADDVKVTGEWERMFALFKTNIS